jgi:sarcosine oxidase subunit alpha
MMNIDFCANARACQYWCDQRPIVKKQGGRGLPFGIVNRLHRFIPAGFQYKMLYSNRTKRRIFYSILKRLTGLGPALSPLENKTLFRNQKTRVDLLVIGGGPAGIFAALEGAKHFESVLLVDSAMELGGDFGQRWNKSSCNDDIGGKLNQLSESITSINKLHKIHVLSGTTIASYYPVEGIFLGLSENTTYEIQGSNVVIATGNHEVLPVFDGNDLPCVMLSGAIQTLLRLERDIAGSRVFILDMDGNGIDLALDLKSQGIIIVGICRSKILSEKERSICVSNKILIFEESLISKVENNGKMIIDSKAHSSNEIKTELLVISGKRQSNYELAIQIGCNLYCEHHNSETLAIKGEDHFPFKLSLCGGILGNMTFEECLKSGTQAIARLSTYQPEKDSKLKLSLDSEEYLEAAISKGSLNAFVCICEDVSIREVISTIEKGYDWIESLKRYTGVVTGPCQGKQCALTVASILARVGQTTSTEAGSNQNRYFTTIRPPVVPIPLSHLSD